MSSSRLPEPPGHRFPFLVRLIHWAQKKKYGETLAPAKLWGRSPPLLYGLQAFYRALDRKSSPLDPSLRSLISVRVSQINHCAFCTDISTSILQSRGIPTSKIEALAQAQDSPEFTDQERAALLYAEAVTQTEPGMKDEIFNQLARFFSDVEIIELTALIGFQNLSSKFNAALSVPPQGFCLPNRRRTSAK